MREVISLDGDWLFAHETDRAPRVARVPGPWQAEFADLRQTSGRASYRRQFDRPRGPAVLRFGAVSYLAEVLVNGVTVGRHEGGYLPFDCPLPAAILKDINDLEVRCLLPDATPNAEGIAFAEIPHGKQSWYGPLGGIWQSVTLERRDPVHLSHCAIRADMAGQVEVTLTLPEAALGADLTVAIAGTSVQARLVVAGPQVRLGLTLASPALWSPDSPSLYALEVTLSRGAVLDQTSHSFGFRTICARGGQMFLNGQPYYMLAALDQDYYPDGICTPPSLAFLEDQVRKAKALGLNLLRCHIKLPDPRYFEVADRLGMLIWAEVPNVGRFTQASAARMHETLTGMLARDGNHPSIIIWSLINEGWGLDMADAGQRRWLAAAYDGLKAADPSRLVCDNSPCAGNFHVKGDLDDYHYYRSVPERRDEFDQLTAEFAKGAPWTWSPHGDGVRRGDEPKIVSEFGVWGLPQPSQVQIGGAEPWWMQTGRTWGEGTAHPHGIEARFAALGLGQVFGALADFVTAAQWYQFANLKYEIETIRAWPQIQGYVITEFTDVHWESNGLLDMNRNPRAFHARFAEVNADVVIVPKVARYSGLSGQDWGFEVCVASGAEALGTGVLRWTCEGAQGEMDFDGASPLGVLSLGTLTLTLPETALSRMLTIGLTLEIGGVVSARNQVDIALFAPRNLHDLPRIAAQDRDLARRAAGLGYPLVAVAEADLILTRTLDQADRQRLGAGARYLLVADNDLSADWAGLGLTARHGTIWRGDWIAGFSWLRRDGAFAGVPGGPMLDPSFSGVVPHWVMTGWQDADFAEQVPSGLVVGWVHKPAALIAARRIGQGRLCATTFRVMSEGPGLDPVADALFDALVVQACGRIA